MINATAPPIAVDMRGITKRFPGVIANERVDLQVFVGEVHALLGENGAGKSTLMSTLCGLYQPDEGEIHLAQNGRLQRAHIQSPGDAIGLGIGMVHQHFKLVQTQTVAENVIIGLKGVPLRLNMRQVEKDIVALARQYNIPVDPQAYIWQISVGEQQRVEILKLLYRQAEILILDEPTAVLTPQEATELGKTLRNMAREGKAIIFISHKLDEIMEIADRVTVLRDGKNVATVAVRDTNKAELARMMVGREVIFRVEKEACQHGAPVLSLEKVSALNDKGLAALKNISLDVCSGEIVGIAGVAGNGQRELAEIITGLRKATQGSVRLRGQPMTNRASIEFIREGVAHIPGDRLGMGLAGNLPISDNLIMKSYRRAPLAVGPFLRAGAIREFAVRLIENFQVLTPGPGTPARNLSGGNQQKAILAREITVGKTMTTGNEVPFLVAVYPTRGLDVGAIETVRKELLEQRGQGAGILLISEELEELIALSDRIAVLHAGEIMGIVDANEADIEQLGLMMAGEHAGEHAPAGGA